MRARAAVLLTALAVGCAPAPDPAPERPDPARIGVLVNDFPATYSVSTVPRATLSRSMIDQARRLPAGVAVDPPRCRDWDTVLPDAQGATVDGAEGIGDRAVTVLAVEVPSPLPAPALDGCDRLQVRSGATLIGTVQRIDVPAIDGAATDGYRAELRVGDVEVVLRTLRARLSDRLTLSVQSRAAVTGDDGLEIGLLTSAVAAVRGTRQ